MTRTTPVFIGWIFPLVCSAVGCQHAMQRHSFPAEWPAGLTWPETKPPAASAVAEQSGPAVAVEPFTVDIEGNSFSAGSGPLTTSGMLTHLMAEKLKQAGVRVSETDAEYTLTGTIPKLGYTERTGYPRKLYYTSELVYHLVHRPSGAVVWQGNLSQDFEQTVLVNTMTRLPNDPNAPERVLLEKCIDPNWALIASDVKAYLKKNPTAPKE